MKDKHFRISEDQAKDFEVLCALLGIAERQAGQLALREWVRGGIEAKLPRELDRS